MKTTTLLAIGTALPLLLLGLPAWSQNAETADPGWPRKFQKDGNIVLVYQPQIDEWKDYKIIELRSALAVMARGEKQEVFGILDVTAETTVDYASRLVTTRNAKRTIRFPNLDPARAEATIALVNDTLPPAKPLTISLDRIVAYMDASAGLQQEIEVGIEPPPIFYSAKPAILVIFMGPPRYKPVKTEALMFAVNTNWDVLFDTQGSDYYLLNGETWLQAPDPIKGPWMAAGPLPASFSQIPVGDDNWSDVRKYIPGKRAKVVPTVYAVTQPAELIVTDGEPAYAPIAGTKLLQVSNTTSNLFMHSEEKQYYFLVAGRWFRAKDLDGPWSAATFDLPADFADIPDDNPASVVKSSVKGTDEAADAVLLASVPNTTRVSKAEPATLTVEYSGAPQFQPIEGTSVRVAANTGASVFLIDNGYYCCSEGVWFCGAAATGPWVLCESVPQAIYAIPAASPYHNVTYVTVVEDDDPDYVYYGYSSGYEGSYVSNGLLMFGMGMLMGAWLEDEWDDDCCGHYYSCWYSYGCCAHYDYRYGGYYRSAHYYGPYGGAGRGAYYNPSTGAYARGAYRYGPGGSAFAAAGYNPFTDTYAARAGISGEHGSAGRFYAERGDRAAWGGHRSGERGSVGWAQGSEGGSAVGWDTRRGQGGVVQGPGGNVYAGKDGNIYRKTEDGSWEKREDGGWDPIDRGQASQRPSPGGSRGGIQDRAAQQPTTQPAQRDRLSPRPSQQPSRSGLSSTRESLDREALARDRGNRNASLGGSGRSYDGGSRGFNGGSRGGSGRGGGGRGGGGRGR